jgi:uncharacterized OB-fold protein
MGWLLHLERVFNVAIACPNCGTWASETTNFCEKCGTDLRPVRSSQAANIPSANLNVAPTLEDMKEASELRKRTDNIISPLWILVPLGSLALSYTTFIVIIIEIERLFASLSSTSGTTTPITPPSFPGLSYLELVSLVLLILFLYLFYTLIKRRNLHFERQYRFFYDASLVLKNLVVAKGLAMNQDVEYDLRYIDYDLTTIHYSERDRSAILWVILAVIPIIDIFAYFYIFYFLMKDFEEHESMEDSLVSKIGKVLASMGANFSFRRENSAGGIPNRNFWLYLILDIITLGAFQIYWIYTLIKDPNRHFLNQIQIENGILSAVESL